LALVTVQWVERWAVLQIMAPTEADVEAVLRRIEKPSAKKDAPYVVVLASGPKYQLELPER
jgi:hypothetical protein